MGGNVILGERYGMLIAVRFVERDREGLKNRKNWWEWRCDCGNLVVRSEPVVRRGATKSCGCLRSISHKGLNRSHGASMVESEFRSTYVVWCAMKSRCKSQKRYVSKGISVCDRWAESFESFLADMGKRPSARHTIDRRDNSGNYTPDNCRWATKKEQSRNTCMTRMMEFEGKTEPVISVAERFGIPIHVVNSRLKHGWPLDQAVTERVRRGVARKNRDS